MSLVFFLHIFSPAKLYVFDNIVHILSIFFTCITPPTHTHSQSLYNSVLTKYKALNKCFLYYCLRLFTLKKSNFVKNGPEGKKIRRKPWRDPTSEWNKREFIMEHDGKQRKENGSGGCLRAKPPEPALLESLNQQPHGPKWNVLIIYNSLHFI